ncbi:MAG: hypothetical protein WBC44_09305 [Planctomycetaceae bacterium]
MSRLTLTDSLTVKAARTIPRSAEQPLNTALSSGVFAPRSTGDVRATRHNPIYRKLLHISPGLLAFLLPALPHEKPLATQALFEITLITAVLTGLYIALKRHVERPHETDFYVTTLSYPAAILGTLFAFPAAPELAVVVLVVLAFGDGSACVVGSQIGGRRLPWNRDKTWAGTIAFAVVGGSLATLAYRGEADPDSAWLAALLCGGGAALVAAVVESLPVRFSDNARVGVVAACTAAVMHLFIVPVLR